MNHVFQTVTAMGLLSLLIACGSPTDPNDSEDMTDTGDTESLWANCENMTEYVLPTGTTWQWQLTGEIDHSPDVHMYDVDLFNTAEAEIATLQAEGRTVICYFSAGTWEDWRPDADDYDIDAIGKTMAEWEDEKWLDVRHDNTREMVGKRLDLAVEKGCDGVEPDNMDAYVNDSGFDLTSEDQLAFNYYVATAAHERHLSVGLKNDVDQLTALVNCFDWALNEECHAYDECDRYAPFIAAGKAVFHVEYVDDIDDGEPLADDICGSSSLAGFSTLVKDWDLTEWYWDCL